MVWFYLALSSFAYEQVIALSIPLWSDFIGKYRMGPYCIIHNLSIPLWSDFIFDHKEKEAYALINFQSHYGLILSQRSLNGTPNPIFQSHYGLILSK